jgi:hypothetical protein
VIDNQGNLIVDPTFVEKVFRTSARSRFRSHMMESYRVALDAVLAAEGVRIESGSGSGSGGSGSGSGNSNNSNNSNSHNNNNNNSGSGNNTGSGSGNSGGGVEAGRRATDEDGG